MNYDETRNNETSEIPDMLFHSAKIRKLAIMLVFAGVLICIIPLLPPVQNALFSFVGAHIPHRGAGDSFESRLRSLLSLPFFGLVVFVFSLCCLFSKNISSFLEDAKNTRLITVSAAGTGVLLLVFVSIFSYEHGAQWLNSDHSSEMVLGKLLADENTFVSRGWHYSTEIRLIYQTIFTMPLFKLIGHYKNWALIRALAILLNNLVLVLSYIFMARQMKIPAKWICITGLFLILPVSTGYWDIVTFGGYYIFFIAQLFCCLGLFARLINRTDTAKLAPTRVVRKLQFLNNFHLKKHFCRALALKNARTVREPTGFPNKSADFILFTALSFMLGVQGIRSLLCVHFPLLITCIYLYPKMAQKQKKNLSVFLGCYGFIVCCVGFAVNYLLHFWYSFHSFENMRLVDLYAEFFPKLGQSLTCLAGFFGLFTGSSLLSAEGLFSVIAIIGTFILFWAVLKSLRQTKTQNNTIVQSTKYQFMPGFFIISVIFNIFVFIVVDEEITERYFIPFMVLYIPLIAILFERIEKLYEHLARTAVFFGIILFICGQGYINFQNLAAQDGNSVRKGYIKYLLDNELDYGFATFWNANVTTELTNGKIELAGLSYDKNHFSLHNWASSMAHSNPSFHQGESFLLLTRAEWELAQITWRPFARLVPDYEDNSFVVIKFPSAWVIHREVLGN